MASQFEKLTPELMLAVIEAVEDQADESANEGEQKNTQNHAKNAYSDLLSLSSTSRAFRTALAPNIFRHINLTNDETSAAFCTDIATGPYAEYVKELRFSAVTAIPDGYGDDKDPQIHDVDRCLPSQSSAILSNLHQFPSLQKLTIRFPFQDDVWWGLAYEEGWPDEESEEELLEAESRYAWRPLPAKTFSAIAQNRPGFIKKFEYNDAILKPVSSWYHDKFKEFLAGLEEFKISLCGGDNGAGWQINTIEAYAAFFAQLSSAFFSRLPNITSLTLAATNSGPIGCEGDHQGPNPLQTTDAPKLQHLCLEQVFIDRPLLDFICAHCDVLETIEMRHCYSCQEDENITWDELLSTIADAEPSKLRSWKILPADLKVDVDAWDAPEEEIQRVHDALSKDHSKRLFPYAYLDDKYGFVFDDGQEMLSSFQVGDDQRAWDRVQDIIAKNEKGL